MGLISWLTLSSKSTKIFFIKGYPTSPSIQVSDQIAIISIHFRTFRNVTEYKSYNNSQRPIVSRPIVSYEKSLNVFFKDKKKLRNRVFWVFRNVNKTTNHIQMSQPFYFCLSLSFLYYVLAEQDKLSLRLKSSISLPIFEKPFFLQN